MPETQNHATALVTGAALRLGRAIALDLAKHGWRIGVHHHTSGAEAESLVDEIERLGSKAVALPADLTREHFIVFESGSITRKLVEEFFTRERIKPEIVMETENVEIIKAMVRNGLGISIIPWQAAAADVKSKQLFCSRISGVQLDRQTGWLYPKMSRLPRAVSEVMAVFETVRPRLPATTRPA